MRLDVEAIRAGCGGAEVVTGRHLCRSELARFRSSAERERPVTVGCTQESALFDEVAEDAGSKAAITYVNIRETAGWSRDGASTGPKMAALLAAAAEPMPVVPTVGLALALGRPAGDRGRAALRAACRHGRPRRG